MRQFVIDEVSPMERDNIDSYLKRHLKQGPMIGLYWVVLPEDMLSDAQIGHEDHGPFYTAVEVEDKRITFEFLVRSKSNLHCTCIAHATKEQRDYILNFIDTMLSQEMINA